MEITHSIPVLSGGELNAFVYTKAQQGALHYKWKAAANNSEYNAVNLHAFRGKMTALNIVLGWDDI